MFYMFDFGFFYLFVKNGIRFENNLKDLNFGEFNFRFCI